MSVARETVNPLPGDLQILISVFDNFLDLGLLPRQLGMAQHAFPNGWNACGCAGVGANMAVYTA